MLRHSSEAAAPFQVEMASIKSGFQNPIWFAVGVMCSVLVSGCRDSKGMSDDLAGGTAGEQRSFGLGHGVDIDFRWAPGGSFMMDIPADETDGSHGGNQRNVIIKDGFWIAKFETTVEVWRKVMGSEPAVKIAGGQKTVACVSWQECGEFLKRLKPPGNGWKYELPTEAQWEYACRAGRTSANARQPAKSGWIDADCGRRNFPGGRKPANAWSLRDSHGNIAEWCRDVVGGQGSDASTRTAAGSSETPFLKFNRVGFRLVLVREQVPIEEAPAPLLTNY